MALLAQEQDLRIVGEARDGVEAVEKARELRPDVITMDVNMPRLDGLGATAAIMAESPARAPGRPDRAGAHRAAHRRRVHLRPHALALRGGRDAGAGRPRRRGGAARARLPGARRMRPGAGRGGAPGHPARRRRGLRAGRGEQRGVRHARRRPRLRRRRDAASPGRHRADARGALLRTARESREVTRMDTKLVAGPQKARFPLLWKISLLVGTTLALVAAVVAAVEGSYFGKVLESEGRARAKAISVTLASALVEMPESAIASTIQSVKKDSGLAYIQVVGPNGNVLAHTFEGKAPAQDPRQLRENEKITEVTLNGVRYVDVPAPVMTGALVHVGLDPAHIAARLREAQMRLFGVTALAMVLAIGIAYLMVRQIISPLRRLTHLTSRILEGDLTQRVDVTSSDEIGELAAAFGAMVEKLKQVVGALQDSVRLLKQAGDDLGTSTSEQSETITRQATALQE